MASGTKQRILSIARDLFARQGFTGTTIADIARELGTTTAALYYHFPAKADILAGLLEPPLAAYTEILDRLADDTVTPEVLLGAFIDLTVESRELAMIIDRDPTVLAMIDERLPLTSEEMTRQVIVALAGPNASHAATIRAQAALAAVKGATGAALSYGGDSALTANDRAIILRAGLRALADPSEELAGRRA